MPTTSALSRFHAVITGVFGTRQIARIQREEKHTGLHRAEITCVMSLLLSTGCPAILLADSDVFSRNFLIRELSREGYFVLGAANWEEAIVLSETFAGSIQLLLANTDLAGRKTLTEKIVRDRPEIQLIVISARTHAALMERSRARDGPPKERTALPEVLDREIRRALTTKEFSNVAEV